MGVGKTERAGMNDSRFTKGRRIDATNDRVLRNLQVNGGRVRRYGDKWTIEPNGDSDTIQAAFPGSAPTELPEGGGIPDGTADKNMLRWDSTAGAWVEIGPYEEIDVVLFTGNRKITGKMLFKASAADVNYDSTQVYKILQVKPASSYGYELAIDHGRLAD
jgi:hypothetical protein